MKRKDKLIKEFEVEVNLDSVEVKALKDFHIVHNEYNIKLVKNEVSMVPKMFIQNLITEGVIKN